MPDQALRQYATDRQWEILCAVEVNGSNRAAAKVLGVQGSTVDSSINALNLKAARGGYSPEHDMTHPVPDGFQVKGTSTMYGPDGEIKAQWVKSQVDRDRQLELMREGIQALCESIKPAKPIKAPKDTNDHILNLYTITDYHVGSLAWEDETLQDNWDTEIAESTLARCFAEMVNRAPDAKKAIICQLGDFLHYDSLHSVTPTSGHLLDSDSRYTQVVRTAIKLIRMVVDMALEKHEEVHLLNAEGNHDIASSVWLREMFSVLYEKESRVTVDTSPLPYYVHQHGLTMLGFHHGHLKKVPALTAQFAAQFPEVWGATKHRYGHSGHLHHVHVKEDMGMTITQHPTLSAKDAHSARGGWHSERRAMWIAYHDEYGEQGSGYVTPEIFKQ